MKKPWILQYQKINGKKLTFYQEAFETQDELNDRILSFSDNSLKNGKVTVFQLSGSWSVVPSELKREIKPI